MSIRIIALDFLNFLCYYEFTKPQTTGGGGKIERSEIFTKIEFDTYP